MNALPYKSKQFFFVLIKIGIVLVSFLFIYHKLKETQGQSLYIFNEVLDNKSILSLRIILGLLLLSAINWFFEILKWKTLVSPIKEISMRTALRQSLGSFTASVFTPYRIGEYGARALFFKVTFRKKILLATLLNNLMQMGATLLFGVVGCAIFINKYTLPFNYDNVTIVVILIFVSTISFILWYKLNSKKKGTISFQRLRKFTSTFSRNVLLKGQLYAIIRYVVFSFQFYVLLHLFHINIGYLDAMVIISTMYLLSSIVPTLFILDVVVKGGISLYLFSFVGIPETTILCIVALMWILNFALPSLMGSVYVLNFKLPKASQNL